MGKDHPLREDERERLILEHLPLVHGLASRSTTSSRSERWA